MRSEPLSDELVAGVLNGVEGADAVMSYEPLDRRPGVARAELPDGLTLHRVALAAVLAQPNGRELPREGAEGPAGLDRGELAVVADEHDLGGSALGVREETGELTGADHARLIDDDHRVGGQRSALVEVG